MVRGLALWCCCSERAVAATKGVGAVAQKEGSQFALNAACCPGCRHPDDPGGVFPKERATIFDAQFISICRWLPLIH